MASKRSGVLAGGNFIVDYVKVIEHFPEQDTLASILVETQANGGGPYNVLKDLALMQAPFPLAAAGMVGDDANGRWIRLDCESHGIDATLLHTCRERSTSYTDAMSVRSTGRRTFFHQRGANALLNVDHFDFTKSHARILHLGYLMLLDTLDQFDKEGRTYASRVLEKAKLAGMETSVDMVSTENIRFREIALSALPFADHLLVNEFEAGKVVGRTLKTNDTESLSEAVQELLALGVRKSVVLHYPEGAVAMECGGKPTVQGSLVLPPGFSQGATGAGDAFAAGYLYGVHEGWPMDRRLELAFCAAAACLTHPSPSAGLRPAVDCLALGKEFPRRTGAGARHMQHTTAVA